MLADLNVLLLTVDSLRADAVIGSANRIVDESASPVLTQFAEDAVVFLAAYSQGPYSSCAISSLLTGRYPRFSMIPPRILRPDRPTIAEAVQRSGYATIGLHSNPLLSGEFGYDRGFERFDESILPRGWARVQSAVPWRVSYWLSKGFRVLTKRPYLDAHGMNKKALGLLSSVDQPWFMWIHYMDVHGPYQSHRRANWFDKWRSEWLWRKAMTQPELITAGDLGRLLAGYQEEIAYWDSQFGILLDALDRMNLLESTVIIVTSDHGEEFSEHGGFSHLRKLYDELLHVPLIVRIPGQQGQVVPEQVGHIDIMPTVLELARVPLDEYELDGHSLLSLIRGGPPGPFADRCLIADATPDRAFDRVAAWTARWKYIYDEIESREYLFDLQADMGEQRNVVDQVDRTIVEPLKATVMEYLSRPRGLESAVESDVASTEAAQVDEEVIRRLVALGYIEDAREMRRSSSGASSMPRKADRPSATSEPSK